MVRIQQSPRLSGIVSALLLFLNQTALAYDLDVNSKGSFILKRFMFRHDLIQMVANYTSFRLRI